MPTEAFEPVFSELGSHKVIIRGCTQNTIIEDVKDGLVLAGWLMAEDSLQPKATGRITFVFGAPYTVPPDPPIDDEDKQVLTSNPCNLYFVSVQHINFCFYDPFRQIPPAQEGGVVWVEMGTDAEESLANLLAAINAEAAITALWIVTMGTIEVSGLGLKPTFEFEAVTFGTAANSEAHGGAGHIHGHYAGFWSSHVEPYGGGYILLTRLSLADSTGPYMQVKVSGSGVGEPGGARFDFTWSRTGLPNIQPVHYIQPVTGVNPPSRIQYTMLAGWFSFWLFLEGRDGSDHNSTIFCVVPSAFEDASPGCVIHFSGGGWPWRNRLKWLGNVYTAREGVEPWGGILQGPIGAAVSRPGVYPLKFPDRDLQTSTNRPLMGNAWLGVPPHYGPYTGSAAAVPIDSTYQPRIIGKIYDALVLSTSAVLDSKFLWRGFVWQCVATQAGSGGSTDCSLWIAYTWRPDVSVVCD